MSERIVVLDRDGVINVDSEHYIKSPKEWEAIPGSLDAIAKLSRSGCRVFIATNQSGVARGFFDHGGLLAIHQKMLNAIDKAGGHIDAIMFSPYGPDDDASCRKPAPGMLVELQQRLNVSGERMVMVGDSKRDLDAAVAAGVQPVLVLSGNGQKTLNEHGSELADVVVYPHLAAFAEDFITR